ncbi:MAG TPA: glycosyltransferase family 87 protein [Blastocatellia bacterium]|nr:glycosyltransferase family 87 protein [Blastocatellia bacterium]
MDAGTNFLRKWIVPAALSAVALASVSYAVITAPYQGKDLACFHRGAQDWVTGAYRFGEGPMPLYPPFALPVFSPLAAIPMNPLVFVWVLLNLATTGAVLYLAGRLFGEGWAIRERFYLSVLLLSWAPFRVTLRVGQISLMITALLLGTLVARQNKKHLLAGVLLGLSLCKYSMALPFLLYFAWKRDWKTVAVALLIPAALTVVFSLRLGLSPIDAVGDYLRVVSQVQAAGVSGWTGTTEMKMLFFSLTGSDEGLTAVLTILLGVAGLTAMAVAFTRTPEFWRLHVAALSLFALWSSYHRTYDAVLCIVPAAVLIEFVRQGSHVDLGRIGLGGLALFSFGVPGLLTDRLGLSESRLSASLFGSLGLHVERLVVFGLFCALIAVAWNAYPKRATPRGSA